jgi:type II secretory pathway pseudopilin PulG
MGGILLMPEADRCNRAGFTIVEILMALVLLSFMVMGFQAATGEIIHVSTQSDRQAVAVELVEDRLDLILLDYDYLSLVSRYAEAGTRLPDYPDLARTTKLHRTHVADSTGVLDYVTVTVTVSGGSLRKPVARTTVVAAP